MTAVVLLNTITAVNMLLEWLNFYKLGKRGESVVMEQKEGGETKEDVFWPLYMQDCLARTIIKKFFRAAVLTPINW